MLVPADTLEQSECLNRLTGAFDLVGGDVTPWYRVTACRRLADGVGGDARVRLTLVADVLAAAVGPAGRPGLTWIAGTE